jgi:hypothetical protein
MEISGLFNEQCLAGVLLIAAFLSFAIGAALAVFGAKGNMGIFTLPVREHLLAIAKNPIAWRWARAWPPSFSSPG